jgi:tetratricopeptide (TPR) repeat protein
MSDLQPPDTHYLAAALGWLELGNVVEAGEEVAKISPALWEHPDVLEVRWQICVAGNSWEAALQVAEFLTSKAPQKDSGWVHRAYALRRVPSGGLQKAWEALRPVYEKFPNSPVIPYNLACYAAQFGRLDEAWEWLHKAIAAAGSVEQIKQMALADADLERLWEPIREL